MKFQFRGVATFTAFIFSAIALTLLFAPNLMLADWGLEVNLSTEVVCRRAAALFAGVGVMLFSARNAEASAARSALVKGVVVICALLATLGVYELRMGNVTPAILIPVAIEVVLMLAFLVAGCSQAVQTHAKRI